MTHNMREWRKAHGLKAREVAEILGYTSEHISRVENGKANLGRNAWRVLEYHVQHRNQP